MRRSIDSATSPKFGYRTLTVLILCAIWFVASTNVAQAGINVWTNIGPEGSATFVYALAIDPATPGTLYAATEYCPVSNCSYVMFKTTDDGGTWVNTGPPMRNVLVLALDPATPTTLYAAGNDVYKSTDGGNSWRTASIGLNGAPVVLIAIDPITPSTLYVGTESANGGLFKSTDGAGTWNAVRIGLIDSIVTKLALDPATPGTLYAGAGRSYDNVFKSTDSGATWGGPSLDDVVFALAIDPATPSTLYAGSGSCVFGFCRRDSAFKTTDGASTWAAIAGLSNTRVNALAIDPRTPTTLYAGTDAGVLKSTDGASSWATMNAGLYPPVFALVIDPAMPGTLYAASASSTGGLFEIEQVCAGDCHGNGQVTVDELVTLVGIALGNSFLSACTIGDVNHDGQITVDEIIMAVNLALDGCT